MAKIPSRDISIDYNYQCKISIEKKNLKGIFLNQYRKKIIYL